jgi:hypothetical protein
MRECYQECSEAWSRCSRLIPKHLTGSEAQLRNIG